MTNHELDELTSLASNVAVTLEPLLLDGYGNFRNDTGEAVPASTVLARLTLARADAQKLYEALSTAPRRRMTKKEAS